MQLDKETKNSSRHSAHCRYHASSPSSSGLAASFLARGFPKKSHASTLVVPVATLVIVVIGAWMALFRSSARALVSLMSHSVSSVARGPSDTRRIAPASMATFRISRCVRSLARRFQIANATAPLSEPSAAQNIWPRWSCCLFQARLSSPISIPYGWRCFRTAAGESGRVGLSFFIGSRMKEAGR